MLLMSLVIVLNNLMNMMTSKLIKDSISENDNEEMQEVILENKKGGLLNITFP